ncbi:MAG: hypothetical protein ACO3G4_04300 [Opitutaceae bacterium]
MSNSDSGETGDEHWEERGELAWNEFDWERYLRGQEGAIVRYLHLYDEAGERPDRIDHVAERMEWGAEDWTSEEGGDGSNATAEEDDEVYTLHKNPIYIATRALYLSLTRSWEALAAEDLQVPQANAVRLLVRLHRGEAEAVEAIHALDFGDYALAVTLFKRALATLNGLLAEMQAPVLGGGRAAAWRAMALPRVFDLREIWLRVIAECRDEVERLGDEE